MTNNVDAVVAIMNLTTWLVAALDTMGEDAIYSELRRIGLEWTLRPELEPVATLAVKAWLEAQPTSVMARRLAVEHLAGMGRLEEAAELEGGAQPRSLIPLTEAVCESNAKLAKLAREIVDAK